MEEKQVIVVSPPPRIFDVFKEAFNLVSHHAELLVLPMLLDLFLLFGPRLRISELLKRLFANLASAASGIPEALAAQYAQVQEISGQLVQDFNLMGSLHTIPFGIPSLFGFDTPVVTPLGIGSDTQLTSLPLITILFIFLTIFGLLLGGIFFAVVAGKSNQRAVKRTPTFFVRMLARFLVMILAIFGICILLAMPYTCIMSISVMIMPVIAEIIAILLLVGIIWLIIPFFYVPQGIFVHGYSIPEAIHASLQFTGWGTMTTISYIFLSIGLSIGMDLIWTIPSADSWLLLFSIFGHAFIETSIIAAGFILYEKLEKWTEENKDYMNQRELMFRRSLQKRKSDQDQPTEIQTDDEEN